MVEILYILALSYALTVAITLALHGIYGYTIKTNHPIGAMEVLAAVLILLGLASLQFGGLARILPRQIRTSGMMGRALILLSVVGALLSVDYLLARAWPLLDTVIEEKTNERTSATRRSIMALTMGAVATSLLGTTTYLESRYSPAQADTQDRSSGLTEVTSSDFTSLGTFETPESPTAAAFSDQGYGYLTNLAGNVFKFERQSAPIKSMEFKEVASGMNSPQGVEVFDGTLYTVDLGEAGEVPGNGGVENVRNSNGKVIAFDIGSEGNLMNRRTILSDLPVVDRQHSPNGIVAGPDSRLYLSIGHLQPTSEVIDDGEYQPSPNLHSNAEYLGTVISFDPDGSDVQIMARGLRNVYDIAFDQDGNLFGAENDGRTPRSKQWHTLHDIVEGGYYGFPEYGTLDWNASDKKIQSPLWILDGMTPVGVEATDKIGYENGVLVGLRRKVVFIPVEADETGHYVSDFMRPEPTIVDITDGLATIVQADPDGLLYVGNLRRQKISILQVESQ